MFSLLLENLLLITILVLMYLGSLGVNTILGISKIHQKISLQKFQKQIIMKKIMNIQFEKVQFQ